MIQNWNDEYIERKLHIWLLIANSFQELKFAQRQLL